MKNLIKNEIMDIIDMKFNNANIPANAPEIGKGT